QGNAPWGLSRISSSAKLPAAGPYIYEYKDKSSGKGMIAYILDTGINNKHIQFSQS
ncbi:hypothetical protein B0T25DRAFT_433706, partial [Lasiosphaeria hispida]